MQIRCPHCHNPIQVVEDESLSDLTCRSCGSNFSLVDEATVTAPAGEQLTLGRFEMVQKLGMGAFGTVWKARDSELDRTVAVKIPRKGQLSGAEAEQFVREARAAAQLRHPNIVSVHEVGRDDDTLFIVSDFVQGVTLADWLTGQQPTSREAAEICVKIANALHHAHECGVIHRDLKPSNIMIDADCEPHIMDFGLAKREAGEITMTVEGAILGTPAYMSPEQAQGEGHNADRRSDVYSLGVILFELLTGDRPFRGNSRMLIHQVLNEEAPSPRKLNGNVPRDLETICLRSLEKDPSRRWETARDLAAELGRYLKGVPIMARPIGRVQRSWRWCQRKPLLTSLIVAIVVLLAGGTIISSSFAILAHRRAKVAQFQKDRADEKATESLAATKLADEKAAEAQARLARLYVANGNSLVEQGQDLAALPRFVHALPLMNADARMARINRIRIGLILEKYPEVVGLYSSRVRAEAFAISLDGRFVAFATTTNGTCSVQVVNTETGRRQVVDLMRGHVASRIALSATGDYVAASVRFGDMSNVHIWSTGSGSLVAVNKPDEMKLKRYVACLQFSPSGAVLVASDTEGNLLTWDVVNGSHVIDNNGVCTRLSFTEDGRRLVNLPSFRRVGSPLSFAHWRVDKGRLDPVGSEHKAPENYLDQPQLAARAGVVIWLIRENGSYKAVLWNLRDESTRSVALATHSAPTTAVQNLKTPHITVRVSSDARRLALYPSSQPPATQPTELVIYDLDTGQVKSETNGHDRPIRDAAFSPDAREVVTASSNLVQSGGKAIVWDVENGRMRHPPLVQLLPSVRTWFVPHGSALVVEGHRIDATADRFGLILSSEVRVWNTSRPSVQLGDFKFTHAVFSRDRSRVAILNGDDVVVVSTLNTKTLGTLKHGTRVIDVKLDRDGRRAVTVGEDDSIRIWNLSDSRFSAFEIPDIVQTEDSMNDQLKGFVFHGLRVAIEPAGNRLAVAHIYVRQDGDPATSVLLYRGKIKFWDIETQLLIGNSIAFDENIDALHFSLDGKYLATRSRPPYRIIGDAIGNVWRVDTGQPVEPKVGTSKQLLCKWMCGDGNRMLLVFGRRDGGQYREVEWRVWDLRSNEWVAATGEFSESVRLLAFNSDGRLVFGSGPTTAQLWRIDESKEFGCSVPSYTRGVIFSENSRLLATTYENNTVRIWDTISGSVISEISNPPPVNGIVGSDNDLVLAFHADRMARLWDARTGESAGPPLSGLLPDPGLLSRGVITPVLSQDPDGSLTFVNLDPDVRPARQLELQSEILSGLRSLSDGTFSSIDAAELYEAWTQCDPKSKRNETQ